MNRKSLGAGTVGTFLLATAFVLAHGCAESHAAQGRRVRATSPVPESAVQLVVVTAANWSSATGLLRRFARAPGGRWSRSGAPIDVVLGRAGLAWGRGLHGAGAPATRRGPVKHEGDGRAPAGAFELGAAYGYDGSAPPGATLAYMALTDAWRCVDDPASSQYNRVLDTTGVPHDWRSAEVMRRSDDLYRRLVVVAHNTNPRTPGAGSCIFLHEWRGPGTTTSGCTAMSTAGIESLVAWLRPGAAYVALPDGEYTALRAAWSLP